MASMSRKKGANGKTLFRVWFFVNDTRHAISLGAISKTVAGEIQSHVTNLERANATNSGLPRHTLEWLTGINDVLHRKIAIHGLIAPRVEKAKLDITVSKLVELFITNRKTAAASTVTNWNSTKAALQNYLTIG